MKRWLRSMLLAIVATTVAADEAQDVLARVRAQAVTVAALNSRGAVDGEGSGVVIEPGSFSYTHLDVYKRQVLK